MQQVLVSSWEEAVKDKLFPLPAARKLWETKGSLYQLRGSCERQRVPFTSWEEAVKDKGFPLPAERRLWKTKWLLPFTSCAEAVKDKVVTSLQLGFAPKPVPGRVASLLYRRKGYNLQAYLKWNMASILFVVNHTHTQPHTHIHTHTLTHTELLQSTHVFLF